ncbi:MAG: ABC transporter ATP-binding protein [Spirochaetes bacterium]|nr:ABC transporter ATP-binding protein [Spirochaetota bacterium]
MSYLEIEDLAFRRNSFELQVSLSLEKGEIGVLLGPSGCGKTSLLRCAAGLERSSGGSMMVHGRQMTALAPERRNLGYVFQDLALFDHLTGRGNMEFGLKLKGWDRDAADKRVDELADKLRIVTLLDRKPLEMSGGERQRLAFARSLAFRPDLLLLDEPLSSLDAPLRRELRAFLGESLRHEGVTALHVTHDVEEALELADTLFLMKNGKIVSRGAPRELYSSPRDAWTISFLGLGSLLPAEKIQKKGSGWSLATPLGRIDLSGRENDDCAEGLSNSKTFCLYIPSRAISIGWNTDVSIHIGAEVFRSVYAGGLQKVWARALACGDIAADTTRQGSYQTLVFEAEPTLMLSPGERIELALDPGLCYMVPDNR